MAEAHPTYLFLYVPRESKPTLTLAFVPTDTEEDGIWVRTNVGRGSFQVSFNWFLASFTQEQVASFCRRLAYTKDALHFELHDTHCSFTMTFASSQNSDRVAVGLEAQLWCSTGSPEVVLNVRNMSAPLSEVSMFFDRVSKFS
jgi:hypothetical protein